MHPSSGLFNIALSLSSQALVEQKQADWREEQHHPQSVDQIDVEPESKNESHQYCNVYLKHKSSQNNATTLKKPSKAPDKLSS
jgi:hypothetical protein